MIGNRVNTEVLSVTVTLCVRPQKDISAEQELPGAFICERLATTEILDEDVLDTRPMDPGTAKKGPV